MALCGVFITFYTMVHVLLWRPALLRRCSSDDPGPPSDTLLSYTFATVGSMCGILHSCPLLPSWSLSLLLVVFWLVSLLFGVFSPFMQSPLPPLRREKSGAQVVARVFSSVSVLFVLFVCLGRKKQCSLR